LNTFLKYPAKEIWLYLNNQEKSKTKTLIHNYLKKFGDRCIGELKLETKTFKQQPENLLEIIKTHLRSPQSSRNQDSLSLRKAAEKEIGKAYKGKPIRKKFFMHVLHKSRTLVSNRENLRFRRTQAYGIIRDIFLAIGKRFMAENLLEHSDDIFYLTISEIFDFIEGKAVSVNLKMLVEMRQKQYLQYNKLQEIDERFKTYGIPYQGNSYLNDKKLEQNKQSLKGIGCCPGSVRQKIRIIKDPLQAGALNGEILVTSSTDPGWVTLFSSISGIIVERGSLLSHSAIVAREMGIPCIVGVTDALKTLNDGDWVEMDGKTGLINIVVPNVAK
jgi:pyruvate,water dikinase